MKKLAFINIALAFFLSGAALGEENRPKTVREVFFKGSNHELEVYKIYGRNDGATMLIVGGIQGDEPGGFLSADSYTDIQLEKGNLIVIPRANFYSIMLFNREVHGVDMNRLFDKTPDDWQGDVVNKIKEYMKESDIFLNLHDGWGFHYPEHINWYKSPDRFGYSVIVDEEEFTCADGSVLKLGETARAAMDAANAKIPDDDPKKHYFNTETNKKSSKFKSMKKSATWYAVSDLCIPAFGIEGSKNMELEKNVLYHNYVINEFMKLAGIEMEYPNAYIHKPEFKGAVIMTGNEEKFVRKGNALEVDKGSSIKVTEIVAGHDRGLTCDIADFGNLNDMDKTFIVEKDAKILFRKDNHIIGGITVKAVDKKNTPAVSDTGNQRDKPAAAVNKEKYFRLQIDGAFVSVKNGETLKIKNGSIVTFIKVYDSENDDYNIPVNFKGWFPPDISAEMNSGDDRGYKITFPPAKIMKKYSVNGKGKLYPATALSDDKKISAKIFIELE